jgi:hypothetical protein
MKHNILLAQEQRDQELELLKQHRRMMTAEWTSSFADPSLSAHSTGQSASNADLDVYLSQPSTASVSSANSFAVKVPPDLIAKVKQARRYSACTACSQHYMPYLDDVCTVA